MGIYYECGRGLVPCQMAKANVGIPACLFLSGPSLSEVNQSDFNDTGLFKVGINTTYPKIRPDMWIGLDFPKCFNKNLWKEPFPKVLRYAYNMHEVDGQKVRNFPFVSFASLDSKYTKNPALEAFNRRSHKVNFIWTKNTFTTALHILVWMGFKEIYLFGADFGGEKDYFDDSSEYRPFNHDPNSPSGSISDKQRKLNKTLYKQQLVFLKKFAKNGLRIGLQLISCTKSSPANSFLAYKSPEDLIKQYKFTPR